MYLEWLSLGKIFNSAVTVTGHRGRVIEHESDELVDLKNFLLLEF